MTRIGLAILAMAALTGCPTPPGQCAPRAEKCNGVDDDCDGSTDEDFMTGAACTRGAGRCASAGAEVCTASGDGVRCDAVEGTPGTEACNGLDDDCDGETDEALSGCCAPGSTRPCGVAVGACTTGTQRCSDERTYGSCQGLNGLAVRLPGEVAEQCNGLDDDCDGSIDEGFPGLGGSCDGPGGSTSRATRWSPDGSCASASSLSRSCAWGPQSATSSTGAETTSLA